MTGNGRRLAPFAAGLCAVVMVGWVLTLRAADPKPQGISTDWTHHHVIFSQPATLEQASRIAQDPRYWHEWYRQNVVRRLDLHSQGMHAPLPPQVALAATNSHADWSMDMGTGASSGAGNYPAKYSFSVTAASCTDYVVFSTGLTGTGTQANIVAYNNVYSGCGANPSVYWTYNTGGQVLTSPVISGDGTQIAFVQTSAGAASLVVLRFAAGGTITGPNTLVTTPASSYNSCTAPCMTTVPLNTGLGTDDDTTSSAFPDYTHDIIWVGGSSGWLHKVTGVFRGVPAEVSTGGYPIRINASGKALTSPVYDTGSGNVFVGDAGGFLYRVTITGTPAATASAQIDKGTVGLTAGPIVDSTAGIVYAFVSNDGSTACTGAAACAAVVSFATNFTSGNTGLSSVRVGTSSATPNKIYEAAFDHTYWSSGKGTGNLYVCGATGATIAPLVYRVPVTAGAFGTAVSFGNLATGATACSAVSDIYNPNGSPGIEERIYFGVQNKGRPTNCGGQGCAMSFVSLPWQASTPYVSGQEILIYRAASNLLYTNVVLQSGTSGATAPAWPLPAGIITTDGSVKWMNQGQTQLQPLNSWKPSTAYALHNRIADLAGNVEVVTTPGTSGTSTPIFKLTVGQTTTDGGVTWTNAGVLPSAALQSVGGTSGIILDNVAGSSPLAGASEIYFSTLGNQACATSGGTGGCAVQASQSALK
jgi:hypothetical protein